MEDNLKNAYSEICEILNAMEDEYVDKVPKKVIEIFKSEKNTEYEKKIDVNIPLEKQGLQQQTLTILAILYLNYWCENEQEKNELIKRFEEFDKEKYSIENIFKNKEKTSNISENKEENSLVEYKESILKKMFNRIKRLFKIKTKEECI